MADDDRVATTQLRPIEGGNAVFEAAVACMKLAKSLAAHLLHDRLGINGIAIGSVTVDDIHAVLPELAESIRAIAGEDKACASLEALQRL